jgi:hypothetical protein
MKRLFLIALVFAVAGVSFGQEFTFRGHQWGATAESIIAKDGEPSLIGPPGNSLNGMTLALFYDNLFVAGYLVNLAYRITQNTGLYEASYSVENGQVNQENYPDVFNRLEEVLIALYGPPFRDIDRRETMTMQKSVWNKDGTMISLNLTITARSHYIFINYISPGAPGNIYNGL